jgi:hypothetical protein
MAIVMETLRLVGPEKNWSSCVRKPAWGKLLCLWYVPISRLRRAGLRRCVRGSSVSRIWAGLSSRGIDAWFAGQGSCTGSGFLLELLGHAWNGDEMQDLRPWFEDIIRAVLDFMELQSKTACISLQIFMRFDSGAVLDFSP